MRSLPHELKRRRLVVKHWRLRGWKIWILPQLISLDTGATDPLELGHYFHSSSTCKHNRRRFSEKYKQKVSFIDEFVFVLFGFKKTKRRHTWCWQGQQWDEIYIIITFTRSIHWWMSGCLSLAWGKTQSLGQSAIIATVTMSAVLVAQHCLEDLYSGVCTNH